MSDKPQECEACYYPTVDLTQYDADDAVGRFEHRKKWLCELCASTETGKILDYPRQYEGQAAAMRTTCYVGNVILTAIKANARPA